jgi:hypothetical protein
MGYALASDAEYGSKERFLAGFARKLTRAARRRAGNAKVPAAPTTGAQQGEHSKVMSLHRAENGTLLLRTENDLSHHPTSATYPLINRGPTDEQVTNPKSGSFSKPHAGIAPTWVYRSKSHEIFQEIIGHDADHA